jgi:MYXO-CTERM domain-containing protein
VLAVVWWIGIYALAFGAVLLVAAFGLRRRHAEAMRHSVPHTV